MTYGDVWMKFQSHPSWHHDTKTGKGQTSWCFGTLVSGRWFTGRAAYPNADRRTLLTCKLGGGNSKIFYFHPYLGKIPILTYIFQMGWNHQLVKNKPFLLTHMHHTGIRYARCCTAISVLDLLELVELPFILGYLFFHTIFGVFEGQMKIWFIYLFRVKWYWQWKKDPWIGKAARKNMFKNMSVNQISPPEFLNLLDTTPQKKKSPDFKLLIFVSQKDP